MTKLYCMTLLALVCASISISVDAKTMYKDTTNVHEDSKSTDKVYERESGNNNDGDHDGNESNIRIVG